MFLNTVWVVHVFLKDETNHILLEQRAHTLSDCSESVVCNGNKWPVYGFLCMHTQGPSRDQSLSEAYLGWSCSLRRENSYLATFRLSLSHSTTQNLHNFVVFVAVCFHPGSYCVVLEVEGVVCEC